RPAREPHGVRQRTGEPRGLLIARAQSCDSAVWVGRPRRVTEFAHDAAIPLPLSTTRTGVNRSQYRIRRTGMRSMLRKLIMTGSTVGLGCLLLAGCGVASSGDGPLPPEADTATADSPAP